MKFSDHVRDLCGLAITGKPQKLSLLGIPGDPWGNTRTIVSRYNNRYFCNLKATLDYENSVVTIEKKQPKAGKFVVSSFVPIPISLSQFLNNGPNVTEDDIQELRDFSKTLAFKLDQYQTDDLI